MLKGITLAGAKALRKQQVRGSAKQSYSHFDDLDGRHPWMKVSENGFVPYSVRELNSGKIAYFNYTLAKEMGLISSDHEHKMNAELEAILLKTFSLQIINEYDELTQKRFAKDVVKPNKYMASRYLQLQHPSRSGKTSGDGRGIWNGTVTFRGKTWDVSSRGTGVTCLAPGAVEANRPLKTGDTAYGYGCGQAEIDELYGAAILAEIMHLQGLRTERVLCIVDLGKGVGIGVRAGLNLFRPAHFFTYLKQNRYEDLKASIDFLIDRQVQNGVWKNISSKTKYDDMAKAIADNFSEFIAQLDIEYIFAWLAWDGDNVLADGGIIDYGSVRQFGIRHDRYRYDDVERMSTNLSEQRAKSRELVQAFAQIADYVATGKKKNIKEFAKHPHVLRFDTGFKKSRAHRRLYKMGFNPTQRENILATKDLFENFDRAFSYFECAKISGKLEKVADGVNHPALFNMGNILRFLPEFYAKNSFEATLAPQEFYKTILSSFAKRQDMKMRPKHERQIMRFIELYRELLSAAAGKQKPTAILAGVQQRAQKLNREDRLTGNGLIQVVDELMQQLRKGLTHEQLQNLIDQLILDHTGMPEVDVSRYFPSAPRRLSQPDLYNKILNLVHEYREDI